MARPTRKIISKPCKEDRYFTLYIHTHYILCKLKWIIKIEQTAPANAHTMSTPFTGTVYTVKINLPTLKRLLQNVPYLIHENIKDACGDRKREESEKKGEEPGGGIHGSMETLGPKMDIQLWKLLLGSQKSKLKSQKTKTEPKGHI